MIGALYRKLIINGHLSIIIYIVLSRNNILSEFICSYFIYFFFVLFFFFALILAFSIIFFINYIACDHLFWHMVLS